MKTEVTIKTEEWCPGCGNAMKANSKAVQVNCEERGKGINFCSLLCNADDLAEWKYQARHFLASYWNN